MFPCFASTRNVRRSGRVRSMHCPGAHLPGTVRPREFRVLFLAPASTSAAASVSSLALGTITYAATGLRLLTAFAMFGGPLVRLVASWLLLSAVRPVRPRTSFMLAAGVSCGQPVQAIPGMTWRPAVRGPGLALGGDVRDRRKPDGAGLGDPARGLLRLRSLDAEHRGRCHADRRVRRRAASCCSRSARPELFLRGRGRRGRLVLVRLRPARPSAARRGRAHLRAADASTGPCSARR